MLYLEQSIYKRIVAATQPPGMVNLTKGALQKYITKHGVQDIVLKSIMTGEETSLRGLDEPIKLVGPSPIKPRWEATIRPALSGDKYVVE